MAEPTEGKRLKKELGLLHIYAVALAPTLSSGFFLLPGLAFGDAGPAVILSYTIAALLVVPPMVSKVELSTAMPRSGGVYYFLDRSMGPMVGTIGGLGMWIVLILKSAFALIGMGAYLGLLWPQLPLLPVSAALAVLFGLINRFGAKKTGALQTGLVIGILLCLAWYSGYGIFEINASYFTHFLANGIDTMLATVGMVYISFVGLTKIASVAEEVKNPERNLPLGVFLALGTTVIVYTLGLFVMVGTVPAAELAGSLTPVAAAASHIGGPWGMYVVSIAALLAFFATANAGILSASRYPLAMSRDNLLPDFFSHLSDRQIPTTAIYVTVGLVLFSLVVLNPKRIAKLASAFQLTMFALLCLAVLVMRESKIEEYDPGYCSPWYPWMQIVGILGPMWIVGEMGWLPILFSSVMIVVGVVWYRHYGRRHVQRRGALLHVFNRLGQERFAGLHRELRGIMREKGLREDDPFVQVVTQAPILDIDDPASFEEIAHRVSQLFARHLPETTDELTRQFVEGQQMGMTPVSRGVALPHLSRSDIDVPMLVIVRMSPTAAITTDTAEEGPSADNPISALFFLISPADKSAQHLRMLAQIAESVDQENFLQQWQKATTHQELKELLLPDDQYLALRVERGHPTEAWIGRRLETLDLPEQSVVALLNRDGRTLVPLGTRELMAGDRLTVIGKEDAIEELTAAYAAATSRT